MDEWNEMKWVREMNERISLSPRESPSPPESTVSASHCCERAPGVPPVHWSRHLDIDYDIDYDIDEMTAVQGTWLSWYYDDTVWPQMKRNHAKHKSCSLHKWDLSILKWVQRVPMIPSNHDCLQRKSHWVPHVFSKGAPRQRYSEGMILEIPLQVERRFVFQTGLSL